MTPDQPDPWLLPFAILVALGIAALLACYLTNRLGYAVAAGGLLVAALALDAGTR